MVGQHSSELHSPAGRTPHSADLRAGDILAFACPGAIRYTYIASRHGLSTHGGTSLKPIPQSDGHTDDRDIHCRAGVAAAAQDPHRGKLVRPGAGGGVRCGDLHQFPRVLILPKESKDRA